MGWGLRYDKSSLRGAARPSLFYLPYTRLNYTNLSPHNIKGWGSMVVREFFPSRHARLSILSISTTLDNSRLPHLLRHWRVSTLLSTYLCLEFYSAIFERRCYSRLDQSLMSSRQSNSACLAPRGHYWRWSLSISGSPANDRVSSCISRCEFSVLGGSRFS